LDFYPPYLDDLVAALADFKIRCAKAFLVSSPPGNSKSMPDGQEQADGQGIPSFPSFDRAARALAKVAEYRR